MMKNTKLTLSLLMAGALAAVSSNAALIAYWDLNTLLIEANPNGTALTANQGSGTFTLVSNPDPTAWDGESGSTVNLLAPSTAGNALRVTTGANTNGSVMEMAIDTTGFEDIVLSFSLDVTNGNGHTANQLAYSSDGGSNFTDFGSTFAGTTGGAALQTFDLSTITGIENNSAVVLQITIGGGSGGNFTRDSAWDNFQVNGTVVPEPSTYALLLGFLGLGMILLRRRRS